MCRLVARLGWNHLLPSATTCRVYPQLEKSLRVSPTTSQFRIKQASSYFDRSQRLAIVSNHPPSSTSRTMLAHRPSRSTRNNTPTEGLQDIIIPTEVLNQAQEIESVPQIPNLPPGEHVTQVEVENENGTAEQVFVVVKEQQYNTPATPHPGDASFYDDCVSDYSHELRQQTKPRRLSPSETQKRMDAAMAGDDSDKVRRLAPASLNGIARSIACGIPMYSGWIQKAGQWFQVLGVYAIRTASKAQRKIRRFADEQTITARLMSFGEDVLSEFENARPSRKPSSAQDQRKLPPIHVVWTHNEIDPSIKTLPREQVLANEQRRRAAQNLPRMRDPQAPTRKPLPKGPFNDTKSRTNPPKPLHPFPTEGSFRRRAPESKAAWERPGYKRPPRVCKPQDSKRMTHPASEVDSEQASFATVSGAGIRAYRSTTPSMDRQSPQQ